MRKKIFFFYLCPVYLLFRPLYIKPCTPDTCVFCSLYITSFLPLKFLGALSICFSYTTPYTEEKPNVKRQTP